MTTCLHACDNTSHLDESWKQLLTTDVIQQYQAPTNVLNILKNNNVTFDPAKRSLLDLPELYLKRDISRIVGHMRLKQLLANEACTAFGVPEKYLIPVVDRKGILDFDKSYVISMNVPGDFVRFWDHSEVEKLLHFSQTGVVDFYYSNIKRDNNGKNWFIDTQLEKTNEDKRYRAAQQLLQNIEWRVLDYKLESRTIDYLSDIVTNYIGL